MDTHGLRELYDLVLRLSAVHDLDALVQEVVDHARRLLGVDVSYLALAEPDGSLVIRVTDGSLGPRLRGVVLPPHSGLAGQVAGTGEPVQSADYLGDAALTHLGEVDRVAEDEGLRTILGVPLRLRGKVAGVLMVSQRAVRRFTAAESSLLTSLGSFAAIAIENAKLVTALAEANDRLERAVRLHDRLGEVALHGGAAEDVVVPLSELVGGLVLVADEHDDVRAAARAGSLVEGRLDGAPSALFAAARRTHVTERVVTVPVASANAYFGALQVIPDAPLAEADVRLLERSAMTVALVASVERAERRTAEELVEHLVTRRVREVPAYARDLRRPHLVVVSEDPRLRSLATLSSTVDGRLVALVRADEATVRSWSLGTTGLAGPATGAAALADAYDDAVACVRVLNALGRKGSTASPADLGPYRYLLSQAGRAEAGTFVTRTLGPLLAHDEERGTDLVHTAEVFLRAGRRKTPAAEELTIHPNTLYQRLDRITALLGEGWQDGDRALDVHLALRLHRLAADLA
ncbi:PucR C-terminal helix-turn-helix domain-containing protein [Amycolatopsis pretoriensis]|uniref:PucR C-terminal helix-turn-helix domain-containing protein n=1 Tax=Amycolatopsis pretoriensis TaxID=218821 RepID=A0A1H5RDG7_9PSEU|nr:GAF domain-containing protein [Amycolatopsis pretoriensis]SEF36369.1 PucR C-terminal helix-turn-helix domain-containing protein [Amycolatopsis pretoriensis]